MYRDALVKLLKDIDMLPTYAERIVAEYDKWSADCGDIYKTARELLDEGSVMSDNEKTIMLLLTVAVKERRDGVWARYPEKVYIHTMRAFSQFIDFYREATGHEGYGKAVWPLRYVNAKVFRFGVLEYELEDGEISAHIPAKSKLMPETVQASLDEETAFMKEFFPERAGCVIYCHSWLLAPALDDMLPANSGIRWFRSIFDITGYDPEDDLYLEFAFKLEYFQRMKGVDFKALREDTSLQRALKKFVLAGGNLGAGVGVLRSYNVM